MPDGHTTNMQDHLADCLQARGLSPAGAVQVANQQAPSSAVDQAMLAAPFKPAPFPEMQSKSSRSIPISPTIPPATTSGPYIPPWPLGKKGPPPPGLKPADSKTNVVLMG